jgi:hypothetical protein
LWNNIPLFFCFLRECFATWWHLLLNFKSKWDLGKFSSHIDQIIQKKMQKICTTFQSVPKNTERHLSFIAKYSQFWLNYWMGDRLKKLDHKIIWKTKRKGCSPPILWRGEIYVSAFMTQAGDNYEKTGRLPRWIK